MKKLTQFITEKILINKNTVTHKKLNYEEFCNLIYKETNIDIDYEDFHRIICEAILGNIDINEDISFIDKTDKEEINYYKTHIRINKQYNKYYLIYKNDEGHLFAYYNRSRKKSSKYYPYVLIVGYESTYLGKYELRLFEMLYKDEINEKLLITKNTNIKDQDINIANQIYKWLRIPSDTKQVTKDKILYDIKSWVNKNSIKYDDLLPCADKETLSELLLNNNEIKEYNDEYKLNELCQYELDKTHLMIMDDSNTLEIRYTYKMICNITQFGTLYIIRKSKFDI